MPNKKISELPAATAPTGPELIEIVQGGINKQTTAQDIANLGGGAGTSIPFGSTSGTNTYTIAATPAVTAYTDGMLLHVKVVNSSTNVSTFNFDSVGAKKVYLTPDTQVTVGMFTANHEYLFTYDSALDGAVGGFLLVGDDSHARMRVYTGYDASVNAWPSTNGSGAGGAIKHADTFIVATGGTLPTGVVVAPRDFLVANADNPGNTSANWSVLYGYLSMIDKLALKQDNIGSATPSTAGATITLDMNSLRQRIFVGSASFATAKILALSNDSVAFLFSFIFQVTNVAAVITMPATFLMTDPNFDGDDWTPAVIGTYELGGTWNGTNWIVKIAGPFV